MHRSHSWRCRGSAMIAPAVLMTAQLMPAARMTAVLRPAVGLAACGAKKTAHGGPATATPGSTSTTAPPPPVAPLTGLVQPNAANQTRRAVGVKIDNVDPARPQSGLDAADVVFEEEVEGQLTRLIAIFQSTDAAKVGPVRSTR